MRTTGKKKATAKRGKGTTAGKRTGSPRRSASTGPKTLADYRKAHKKIPGSVYTVREKRTQVIHKKNYAPLGRPPSDPKARAKYNRARMTPTPTKEEAAEIRERKRMYADRAAMEYYKDYRADRFLSEVDSEFVDSELEDRGYADTRKNWRQTGKRTRAKAYMDEARQEWRDREYGYGY